jgi:uncharacterized protein YndB with AHSA1/START domain
MNATENLTLRIERTFSAPIERVFDAWTSAEVLRRWLHADPRWETPEAAVDLRVGGAVRVVMRNPETGAEYGGGGEYTEIDRPRRLAFTWVWDSDSRQTLVELEFAEVAGGTVVTFDHCLLLDEAAVRAHDDGWRTCFDNLEAVLATGAGG